MTSDPSTQREGVAASAQTTNGLAVAALVSGIVWFFWIGSIIALIFGYVAKGQIDRSGGSQTGRGMAIAGIVLGWVGIGILLLVIVGTIGGIVVTSRLDSFPMCPMCPRR
ncbi:MAG: DUF4190 domain-containing protein [Egibacteraceae bacterium]